MAKFNKSDGREDFEEPFFPDNDLLFNMQGFGFDLVEATPFEYQQDPFESESSTELAAIRVADLIEQSVEIGRVESTFATGESRLFKSPSQYKEDPDHIHIHGADMMLSIGRLTDEILHPAEEITRIDRAQWSRVSYNELSLEVWTGGKRPEELPQDRSRKLQVKGAFTTSEGRTLNFRGYDSGTPCRTLIDYSSPGLAMFKEYTESGLLLGGGPEVYMFNFGSNAEAEAVANQSPSSGVLPSFMLDLANAMGGEMYRHRIIDSPDHREGEAYVGRALTFDIPSREMLPQLHGMLTASLVEDQRMRTGNGYFEMIPGKISINVRGEVVGEGEVHLAYPVEPSR